MRAKAAERQQARELRLEGLTYHEIAEQLGVSKSSVSLWTRDLPRPTPRAQDQSARLAGLRRYYDDRRRRVHVETQNQKLAWANSIGPLTDRELLIAGAVAYWAEGSKSKPWRRDETVSFINSDPDMVRLFLRWLMLAGIGLDRCSFRVMIHQTADLAAAVSYWAALVGIDPHDLRPTTIKRHRPKTVRHNTGQDYHGCLVIRVVKGADTYRQMEGIWWAVRAAAVRTREEPSRVPRQVVLLDPVSQLHPRLARFRRILRQGSVPARGTSTV